MYIPVLVYSIYRGLKKTCKMLRFGLVLLLAASACAAPNGYNSDLVYYQAVEGVRTAPDSGRADHLTDSLLNTIDNGELSYYLLSAESILNDLASLPDSYAQALAVANAIGTMSQLAVGVAGDVCTAADLLNGRGNIRAFINRQADSLALLANLVQNPQSARFSNGIRQGCSNGGRIADFEDAWSQILAQSQGSSTYSLVYELYCNSKRMYNAVDVKHNNAAIVSTAASLPVSVAAYGRAIGPVRNFVNALRTRTNIGPALAQAQSALRSSV